MYLLIRNMNGWSEEVELPVQCGEPDLGFDFQIAENEELPFQ